MGMSARRQVALEAVEAAATAIRYYDRQREKLKVEEKKPGDFVTNADTAAEAAAIKVIKAKLPTDGILSEECGQLGPTDRCWVLDPIDGTGNFVHGLPFYAVSLAWCEGGEPKLGVIYDVCRDETYLAERGRGAYCDRRRIRVSGGRRLIDSLVCSTGSLGTIDWRWNFLAEVASKTSGIRRPGSSVLEFALTARGCLDASFGGSLRYWDCAAGVLMVREAGGTFLSDLGGGGKLVFGEVLKLCLCGTPRVVGTLRKIALRHRDAAVEKGG